MLRERIGTAGGAVKVYAVPVLFTTRRLLTMVLIERLASDSGSRLSVTSNDLLDDAWMVLRRMQRLLNDHARSAPPTSDSVDSSTSMVSHRRCTVHSGAGEKDAEVEVVADAHCVSAHELMRRHDGVLETFSRSSQGKTWTPVDSGCTRGRRCEPDVHGAGGQEDEHCGLR